MNVYPVQPDKLDFSNSKNVRYAVLAPMRQGDTFKRRLYMEDFDLENHDLRAELKDKDDVSVLYMSTGNGQITKGEDSNGSWWFEFNVDAAVTETIEVGKYDYDVELITPTGNVHTILQGKWQVTKEYTTQDDTP